MTTTQAIKPRCMPCWGEHEWLSEAPLRLFNPTEDGDLTCTHCGWMQSSSASGAFELCMSATWHVGLPNWREEYEHLARIARSGGHEVPSEPPNTYRKDVA